MNTHDPVLVEEVLFYLRPEKFAHSKQNTCFVDATVGYGGHSKEFVRRGIYVLGIDTDEHTLSFAHEELKRACPGSNKPVGECFKLLHGNFKDIALIVQTEQIQNIYGVLIDLGVSTPQLTSKERGLSFQNEDAELDMRLDTKTQQVYAYELLNALPEHELFNLFHSVMEFSDSKKLAKQVIETRTKTPFKTVGDFLRIIPKRKFEKTHPATKAFMALRMAVNSELQNIEEGLPQAFSVLENEGRLAVISFHSGEDALVKEFMREMETNGEGKILTKKPIVPGEIELTKNPRARSAKLRVLEKI